MRPLAPSNRLATPRTAHHTRYVSQVLAAKSALSVRLAEAEEDIVDEDGRNDDDGEELEDVEDPVVASLAQELGGVRLIEPLKGLPVSCGTHTRF